MAVMTKKQLKGFAECAKPEVGAAFINLILQFIEVCDSPRQARAIKRMIKAKLTTEIRRSIWRIIQRAVKLIF